MRIDQLKYFIHVAETCSITQSAKHLHISQQGLSQSIKSMEKELGISLFERNCNKIILTKAGEVIFEKVKDILEKYEEMLIELEPYLHTKNEKISEFKILVTPLMNKIFMPKLLFDFINKYPEISTNVVEKKPLEIIDEIKNMKNSIGIISIRRYVLESINVINKSEIIFEKLDEYGVFATLAKTSPLATRKIISTKELIKYPIVVFNAGQHIRTITDLFKDIGKPNLKILTTDWDLYHKTIANGLAIGISNGLPEDFQKKGLFVNVPIETTENFNLVTGYVLSAKQTQYPFVKDLIEILKSFSVKDDCI